MSVTMQVPSILSANTSFHIWSDPVVKEDVSYNRDGGSAYLLISCNETQRLRRLKDVL
jgi:hypothetical protein